MSHILYMENCSFSTYEIPSHKHISYEILYITSGKAEIRMEQESLSLSEGTILLLAPELVYSISSIQGFSYLHAAISGAQIPVETYECFKDRNGYALHLLHLLYMEHLQNKPEVLQSSLCEAFFSFLYANAKNKEKEPICPAVIELMEEISLNLSNKNFNLSDALSGKSLPANELRKRFKKETGFTPKNYLIEKRMAYAKKLLQQKELTGHLIQDISKMCGFFNPFAFSLSFKKHTGLSPTDWYEFYFKHGEIPAGTTYVQLSIDDASANSI